jgi:hypothetical protein
LAVSPCEKFAIAVATGNEATGLASITPSPKANNKQVSGWLLEKAARLKLDHAGSADFAMFESLELLALGVHGQQCLLESVRGRL